MEQSDFLVIGGGIAGLTFALEAAKSGSVTILFKSEAAESSTAYAQGGIAAVSQPEDDVELHVRDTLRAGAGLCREPIVRMMVTEALERIRELEEAGVRFDRVSDSNSYHLHREGGHSKRRIFHVADATGAEIQRALLRKARAHPQINFCTFVSAVDLITTHKIGHALDKPNKVLGAYVLEDAGAVVPYIGKRVLVATGGAGKVYLYTSNPDVATGDGIAMCYRAGAEVANMEFFQFHPTCLYHPEAKSFLLSEALRGEGAHLKRINGERFMERFHSDGELAPRDVVARAIDHVMKLHGEDHVLLDISHRGGEFVRSHFPNLFRTCMTYGHDLANEPVPVVPAAHFCCGGVVSDEWGQCGIESLYVAGECAHTGVHGANRLASNSLLEGVVFAHRAAQHASAELDSDSPDVEVPAWDPGAAVDSEEEVVISQNWDEVRRLMWNYVGIVRSDKRLERALRRIQLISDEIRDYYWNFHLTSDLLELRNISLVAELIIRSAMSRKESRGLHYNLDYPDPSSDEAADTVLINSLN